jgi:hypothetical protein
LWSKIRKHQQESRAEKLQRFVVAQPAPVAGSGRM